MIYGYARVSTQYQAREGNSLEAQERALKNAGAEIIFSDAYTGTKIDRPEFHKLLDQLKEGDTLIVTKLDRIARSVTEGSALIRDLLDRHISINILNMGLYENGSAHSKFMINIMLAFAEMERDLILERTAEGKAIRKEKGNYKEGRPANEIGEDQLRDLYNKTKLKEISINDACEELSISRSSWYKYTKCFK